jgi:hypothetical protein
VAHHSGIHKHADTFSFKWSDNGDRVLVDSGKWGYDEGPERSYVTGPRAHNVVELEGAAWRPRRAPDQIPWIVAERPDNVAAFHASGRHAPGRWFDPIQERRLILSPNRWLIVSDDVWSPWPRTAVQWFQLPPEAEVEERNGGFLIRFPWSESTLQAFSLVPVEGLEARKGERGERWAGWYSPRYRQIVPSWQIGFRSGGFGHRFATVFRWAPPQEGIPEASAADPAGGNFCWQEGSDWTGVRLQRKEENETVVVTSCDRS